MQIIYYIHNLSVFSLYPLHHSNINNNFFHSYTFKYIVLLLYCINKWAGRAPKACFYLFISYVFFLHIRFFRGWFFYFFGLLIFLFVFIIFSYSRAMRKLRFLCIISSRVKTIYPLLFLLCKRDHSIKRIYPSPKVLSQFELASNPLIRSLNVNFFNFHFYSSSDENLTNICDFLQIRACFFNWGCCINILMGLFH